MTEAPPPTGPPAPPDPRLQPQFYGGHPGYGGWPPPSRGTNGLAIASLVCAFVLPPLGLIFGFIAKTQIRQSGEEGDGLATAAIVVSIVLMLALLLYLVLIFALIGAAVRHIEFINNSFVFPSSPP